MMDSRYQNRLTDLVKRIRPLLVGVAEQAASSGKGTYFVSLDGGYDQTGTAILTYDYTTFFTGGEKHGIKLVEGNKCFVYGRVIAPPVVGSSHSGTATYKAVLTYNGSGDIYCRNSFIAQGCNQVHGHVAGLQSYSAVTLDNEAGNWVVCISEHSIGNLDKDDVISLAFERDASHASDTYADGNIWLQGFLITF